MTDPKPIVPFLRAEWTAADAVALRGFLESSSGRAFLTLLASHRPGYSGLSSAGYDATRRLIESGKVEGYDLAFFVIQAAQGRSLLHSPTSST